MRGHDRQHDFHAPGHSPGTARRRVRLASHPVTGPWNRMPALLPATFPFTAPKELRSVSHGGKENSSSPPPTETVVGLRIRFWTCRRRWTFSSFRFRSKKLDRQLLGIISFALSPRSTTNTGTAYGTSHLEIYIEHKSAMCPIYVKI